MKKHFNILFLFLALCILPATAKKYVLVIDAGHGGKDAGAVGSMSKEKDINLKVALAFGKYVQKNCPDVNVIYTRKSDVFLELYERAEIANKNHADVFVSIHTNSLPAGHISRGAETYTMTLRRSEEKLSAAQRENSVITYEDNYEKHYAGFDSNSEEMIIMYEHIHDENMKMSVELAKCIQNDLCSTANRPNKGVKQDNFHVLRRTSMPACLVELGFISTPDEEAQLNNSSVIDKMAYGIYKGFVKYKNKTHAQADATEDSNKPLLAATTVEPVNGPVVPVVAAVPSSQSSPKSKEVRKAKAEAPKTPTPSTPASKQPAAKTQTTTVATAQTATAATAQTATVAKAQTATVAKSEFNEQEEMIRLQKLKEIERKYQEQRGVKQELVMLDPKTNNAPAQVKPEVVAAVAAPVVAATVNAEAPKTEVAKAEVAKVEEPKPAEPAKKEVPAKKEEPAKKEAVAQTPAKQEAPVDPEQLKKQVVKEIFEIANVKQPDETKDDKKDTEKTAAAAEAPVFKVQLLSCSRMLKEGDSELKGLTGVSHYQDGNFYKFTIGECSTAKEATELKKSIADKFPDSFIIAIQNGQRIDINTALQWKK